MKTRKNIIRIQIWIITLIILLSGGSSKTLLLNISALSDNDCSSETTFTVNVVSDATERIDLSGIVFHVYESILSFTDRESGLSQYDETFVFDVYTNSNGQATFERPSAYFSVTMDLDSVPEGYGVDKHTEFYYPYTYNSVFCVNEIDHIVSNADSLETIDCFSIYDKNNTELFASLETQKSTDNEELFSSIFKNDELTFSLRVFKGNFEKKVEVNINLSSLNAYEKAQYLYDAKLISLEEKLNYYCDSILNCGSNEEKCIRSVLNELFAYKNNNTIISKDLKSKIDLIFEKPFNRATNNSDHLLDYSVYSSSNFYVLYDNDILQSDAAAVALYFEYLRSAFYYLGFTYPILQSDLTKMIIYLTQDEGPALAVTIPDEENGNKCASYIVVYEFEEYDTTIHDEIFAHEYFHAIQNAYNYTADWFSEASANWAATKVSVLHNNAEGHFDNYLRHSHFYIYSDHPDSTHGYGCYFLLYGIEKDFGGVDTIVGFYELYSYYPLNCSNDVLISTIEEAMYYEGYTFDTFDSLFENCAVYNSFPSYFYESVYETDLDNPFINQMTASASSYSSGTRSINKYGSLCFDFKPYSNTYSTLSVTMDVTSDYARCKYVLKGSNNSYSVVGLTPSSMRFTVTVNNFGNTSNKELVLIPYCLSNLSYFNLFVSATKS